MEEVILVDEHDREIGYEEKLRAHTTPRLHRAFSIFVTNSRGQILMQQRAVEKYHSPRLWSNTCCGHPRPHEEVSTAARRRLFEEMGVICELHPTCVLRYKLEVGTGLVEHELNHVFVGVFDGVPHHNPAEVAQWRWVEIAELREMRKDPGSMTPWFECVLDGLLEWTGVNGPTLPSAITHALGARTR